MDDILRNYSRIFLKLLQFLSVTLSESEIDYPNCNGAKSFVTLNNSLFPLRKLLLDFMLAENAYPAKSESGLKLDQYQVQKAWCYRSHIFVIPITDE